METKRLYYLDLLKIISAFMVTFYHFSFSRLDFGYTNVGLYIPNFNNIIMNVCSMSVPLFFMVSGALTLTKDRSVKYIGKKVLKIVFLIVVWYIAKFPACFFKTLIILYIITPVLRYLIKKNIVVIYILMIGLFIMPFMYNFIIVLMKFFNISLDITIMNKTINTVNLNRTGVFTLYSILYYLLGSFLRNSKTLKKRTSILIAMLGWLLVCVDVSLSSSVGDAVQDGVNGCFPTVGALLLAFGTFNLVKSLKYENSKIVKFISAVSPYVLSMYVMHLLVLRFIFIKIMEINGQIPLVMAVMCSVIADIICILIGMIINKIPYIRETIKI